MDVVYYSGGYDVDVATSTWSQSGKSVVIDGTKGTITKMSSNSMTNKDDEYGVELTYTICPKVEMDQYLKYAK